MTRIAVRRALISVYDKTGLDELARGLHGAGHEARVDGVDAPRKDPLDVLGEQLRLLVPRVGERGVRVAPGLAAGLLPEKVVR